jgi:hypothetical protein
MKRFISEYKIVVYINDKMMFEGDPFLKMIFILMN